MANEREREVGARIKHDRLAAIRGTGEVTAPAIMTISGLGQTAARRYA